MDKKATPYWKGSNAYWRSLVSVYQAKLAKNPKSFLYVSLADAQSNLGDTDEAIQTLEFGLALMPESRSAKVLLAQLYYDQGNIEKSKQTLEYILGRWPDVTAAVSLLCKIYEREGRIEKACKLSLSLLNYFPDVDFVKTLVYRYGELCKVKDDSAPVEMTLALMPPQITEKSNQSSRMRAFSPTQHGDNSAHSIELKPGADGVGSQAENDLVNEVPSTASGIS